MYRVIYPLPLTTINCFSFVSTAINFWNYMSVELTPLFLVGFSSFPLKNSPPHFLPTSYTANVRGPKYHASTKLRGTRKLAGLTPRDFSRKELLMCYAPCLSCWLIVPWYFLKCPSLPVFLRSRSWNQSSLTASVFCLSAQESLFCTRCLRAAPVQVK